MSTRKRSGRRATSCGSIDAAEYKHVVLGLIFLKYVSDAFQARHAKLAEELKEDGIEGSFR